MVGSCVSFTAWWLRCIAFSCVTIACSSSDKEKPTPEPKNDAGGQEAGKTGGDAGSAPACGLTASLVGKRASCGFQAGASAADTLGSCAGAKNPIEHVVVIMQENRSFDQYFGHLPGHGQNEVDVAADSASNPPATLDGGAGDIEWFHDTAYCEEDTDHGWVASHRQWNGGKNDGFALTNASANDPTGHRALGYYDQTDLPFYYDLISTFATSDRYFCSVLGPTYPNRMYLYAGTSFGIVTTDTQVLAPPGVPNLFKTLSEKGVTWKEYKAQIAATLIFPDFATDEAQASHFVDIGDFAKDAAAGTLPSVSFLDPTFVGDSTTETDEHPPANIQLGQAWVYDQVSALLASPEWKSSALFITYDEHGGLYDHVSPPEACAPDDTAPRLNPELGGFDRLGFRVPLIVVSPYAKRHFVSHETHSHTSILRFIEAKFDLPAFTNRDANSDALFDVFDFDAPPNLDVPTLSRPPVDGARAAACAKAFPPPSQ
jgi:phospholipase C